MEDVQSEKHENQASCTMSKQEEQLVALHVPQTQADSKLPPDFKNTQTRTVHAAKKLKVDNDTGTQNERKLWSMEDKNMFFKALNKYGKDFDALQSYFLHRGKKRGLPDVMIKNKEQIRHFYYRTWLKISKHLKFSEDVKKTSQELYGLINYGELRRKLPRNHEKVHLKLNELVYWGSTQARLRGKTMRIKTPICRALRKLNQLEDWQEDIKLPSRISVELRPRNNMAWWQVQAASMNPRVRTLLPIQRSLSGVLTFLQDRWRPAKYITYANMETFAANELKDIRLLRVAPTDGCEIALPVVKLGEYLTSNSVSLNSYEERLGLKSSKTDLLGSVQYPKGVSRKDTKRCKSLTPETPVEFAGNICEKPARVNNLERSNIEQSVEPNRFPGRETIDRIRKGWTVEEANTITIGDLFLMFGRESKVTLEYSWDTHPRELPGPEMSPLGIARDDSLRLALQKLLSLAKHAYGADKVYDNTSGSNETVVSSSAPSTRESTFRRPVIRQTCHKIGTPDAFKTQLDASGEQSSTLPCVPFTVPARSTRGTFQKFKTRFCTRGRALRQKSLVTQRALPAGSGLHAAVDESLAPGVRANVVDTRPTDETPTEVNETQEKIFLDVLQGGSNGKATNSVVTSATQILKEGDQWLNSEVADFSLSSFLGQLESPVKVSQRSQSENPATEDTRPSSDVVSHLQCLMSENSVDYMAKFANLAS